MLEREGRPGGTKFEELAPLVAGERGWKALTEGNPEGGVWGAGLVMGLIHDIPTVRQLIERIIDEAEALIKGRLSALIDFT